ncbi:MAG: alpha/beta hydrolase [Deinococcales bacterium]
MPLDPQARALLDELDAAGGPPASTRPPAEARRVASEDARRYAAPPEPVAEVRDLSVEGPAGAVPVRVYTPPGPPPFPVLVYFHGGGFLFGGPDEVDDAVRHLAARTPCVAVSVDYRLAPEHPFPAAAEDAFVALSWAQRHAEELDADPQRIAVAGDSAGGNLAAVVCLMARDRGLPPPLLQLLVYPVVDFAHPERYPSTEENGEGYLLTKQDMETFRDHYLPDGASVANPYASPILADSLGGLPPAWVLLAGYDPLRDQGARYAERLRQSGGRAELRTYPDMIHGFFTMAGVLDRGREARDEAAERLRRAFGEPGDDDGQNGGPR